MTTNDNTTELVIKDLADAEAALIERNRSLEAHNRSLQTDVAVYREMCSVLLDTIALMKSDPANASARERFALDFARVVVRRGLDASLLTVKSEKQVAA